MAQEMESFEALLAEFEQAQTSVVREGEIVSGKVVDFVGDFVVVDIGYKSEGQVPKDEFKGPDGELTVKVGDTVDVYVEATENENGLCVLSKKEADKLMIWEEIAKIAERDETVEGTIMSRVKGGLAVDIGVRAFLPGSQVELRPTRNLDKFINQKYRFKIIKFNISNLPKFVFNSNNITITIRIVSPQLFPRFISSIFVILYIHTVDVVYLSIIFLPSPYKYSSEYKPVNKSFLTIDSRVF